MPALAEVDNDVAKLVKSLWPRFQMVYAPAKAQPEPVVSKGGGITKNSGSYTHDKGIAVDIIPGDVSGANNRQTLILFGLFLLNLRRDLTVYFYDERNAHVHIDMGTHDGRPKFGTNIKGVYSLIPRKYSVEQLGKFGDNLKLVWESYQYTPSYIPWNENYIKVFLEGKNEPVPGKTTSKKKWIIAIIAAIVIIVMVRVRK